MVMSSYKNPVLDLDFPDPCVLRASDGWYYAYATQTVLRGKPINIQMARSADLIHWEHLGDALPVKPRWASQTQIFWAPTVVEHNSLYYMYFSADPNTHTGMCLAVATSTSPAGPFLDVGQPLKCGPETFTINPMAFDDPHSGRRFLYWGAGRGPIRVQELGLDRTSLQPGSQPLSVLRPDAFDVLEALVEGAWVHERDGAYYLFYSSDDPQIEYAQYGISVGRAGRPTGPFEKRPKEAAPCGRFILAGNDHWHSPGRACIVRDAAGTDWIFYHAIDPRRPQLNEYFGPQPGVRRVLMLDRLVYTASWPSTLTGSPSFTEQSGPAVA